MMRGRRQSFLLLLFTMLAAYTSQGVKPGSAQETERPSPPAAIRQYRDAVLFQNRGDYDLAVDEWQVFLKRFKGDALEGNALHYAGVCYLQLKNYEEARKAFETVLREFPKLDLLDQTHLNLGLTWYSLAQAGQKDLYAKAAGAFDTVRTKYPNSPQLPQALFYLGESLYAQGKPKEAIAAWSELNSRFPKHELRADALYAMGVTQEEVSEHAEAGKAYDALLANYPKHRNATEVGMRKGETLFAAGQFAEAEKRFAAAAAAQNFALADHATLRRGASLYEQKKYAEAAEVYASIPTRFKQSKYVPAAMLAAGSTYYLAGQHEKAQSWLDQAFRAGGATSTEAAHWLARTLLKRSQPAEALKVVEAALPKAGGSSFEAHLLMDRADALYEISERRGEAVAAYAQFAEKFAKDALAPQAAYMAAFGSLKTADYKAALNYSQAFLRSYSGHELTPDVKYVAAESHLLEKNYAEAAKLYEELLAANSNHADAQQWLVRHALALQLLGQHDRVIQSLQSAVAKLKFPETLAEAQHLLGNAYLELNNFGEAAKAFSASLAASPKWRQADEALLNLSRAYRGQDNLKAAIETVNRLIKEYPKSNIIDRANFRLGEYAYAAKDYETAMRQYRAVIDGYPQSALVPHALYGLAWSELSLQNYDRAEETFTAVAYRYANHELAIRSRYARASARQQLQNFSGALEDVDAFLATNPPAEEKADALYLKALCQVGLQQFEPAIATLRSIREQWPEYKSTDKVLYELGWALKSSGKEAEAAEVFGTIATQQSQSPLAAEALFHVGEFRYHQQKDYKGAAQAYFQAQKQAGRSEIAEKAQHKLAWAYYQLGDYPGAQQTFESQLAGFSQGTLAADAQFMIGECLLKQNKSKEALASYQKALKGKLTSKDFEALALLHAAQCASREKQWEQSLTFVDRLLEQHPDSEYRHEGVFELASVQQNLGKLDNAAEQFETVAEESNSEIGARARFMLGEIQFAKKDHKEAIRNFFKVAYGYGHPSSPEAFHVWQAAATYEAARCFEVLKSPDRAKKLYAELIQSYPKSDKAPLAKQRLSALGG